MDYTILTLSKSAASPNPTSGTFLIYEYLYDILMNCGAVCCPSDDLYRDLKSMAEDNDIKLL